MSASTSPASGPKTLYDKIWDAHLVNAAPDGTSLLYIDRHLVHEVTSPQAFEGLRMAGRGVRAPEKTTAVPDHNLSPRLGLSPPQRRTKLRIKGSASPVTRRNSIAWPGALLVKRSVTAEELATASSRNADELFGWA